MAGSHGRLALRFVAGYHVGLGIERLAVAPAQFHEFWTASPMSEEANGLSVRFLAFIHAGLPLRRVGHSPGPSLQSLSRLVVDF